MDEITAQLGHNSSMQSKTRNFIERLKIVTDEQLRNLFGFFLVLRSTITNSIWSLPRNSLTVIKTFDYYVIVTTELFKHTISFTENAPVI